MELHSKIAAIMQKKKVKAKIVLQLNHSAFFSADYLLLSSVLCNIPTRQPSS
jgi:hypothetical protein